MWSTRPVPVTRVSGRSGRIELSLDGLTFVRPASEAARRGAPRLHQVAWQDVTGAEIQVSRKGRPIVRVGVAHVPRPDRHREDPHALKVPRNKAAQAQELVDRINEEASTRRRWRQHSEA
jgi:hypothetical protein